MATKRVPILGPMSVPDSSGGVYFEPASANFGSNDLYPHLVLVFANSNAREGIRGLFSVPQDYVDTANIVVVWSTTATTGSAVFDFDYAAIGGDASESLDPAADDESATVTDAASGTARQRQEATIAVTDGNLAAGDSVLFELFRESDNVSDDLAASAYVFGVFFEYNDA